MAISMAVAREQYWEGSCGEVQGGRWGGEGGMVVRQEVVRLVPALMKWARLLNTTWCMNRGMPTASLCALTCPSSSIRLVRE